MMKGARLDTFAMASISSGNGSFKRIEKCLSSPPFISSTTVASVSPSASRAIQRLSEAVQSAPRTGCPSWNLSPSRKVKL
jgi:hypothetical protein